MFTFYFPQNVIFLRDQAYGPGELKILNNVIEFSKRF